MSEINFVFGEPEAGLIASVNISGLGSGAITVTEAADGKITGQIQCSDGDYLERTEIRQSHDQLRIDFPSQGRTPRVYVELAVPPNLSFQIGTGSADVNIQTSITQSRISTGSGDIGLRLADSVRCATGSGDITIGTVTGSANQLNTGSGDITVNDVDATLGTQSGSGSVTLRNVAGRLRANTASGDINIPATTGTLELRTASGDVSIGVADDLPAWLDLRSVTGDVTIGLDATNQPTEGEPFVAINANTASGDISIHRA